MKLEFCYTLQQVFITGSNTPGNVALTLDNHSIFEYNNPKQSLVGISHYQYDIQPWSFTVKYSDMIPILDRSYIPIPMDDNNVLLDHMFYFTDGMGDIHTLFVLFDSIEYSLEQNTFQFQAVNMIGVISKYSSANITNISLYNIQEKVPHQMFIYHDRLSQYDDPIYDPIIPVNYRWDNLSVKFTTYIKRLYNTIVLNIFTNNGMLIDTDTYQSYFQTGEYWGSQHYYLVRSDALNQFPFFNIYRFNFNLSLQTNPYIVALVPVGGKPFLDWLTWMQQFIRQSTQVPYYNPTTYPMIGNTHRTANEIPHYQEYGQRACIDFINDGNGYTFQQLIIRLIDAQYFKYNNGSVTLLEPYILTTSTDPGDIDTNQHVIGIFNTRPAWLDASNPYYYRNIGNDNIKRRLKIQLWKYVVLSQFSGTLRKLWIETKRLEAILDQANPTNINVQDYGFQLKTMIWDMSIPISELGPQKASYNRNIYMGEEPGVASDDFIKFYTDATQDKVRISYGVGSRYVTLVNQQPLLTDTIQLNTVASPNTLNIQTQTKIDMIDMLKQILLFFSMTFTTVHDDTYNTCRYSAYTNKFLTNDLTLIDISEFTNLTPTMHNIYQYKQVPYVRTLPQKINKYGVFKEDVGLQTVMRRYYKTIQNNYKTKLQIQYIGYILDQVNLTTNRYFLFKELRYLCTSIKYDAQKNLTIIQGYGGI